MSFGMTDLMTRGDLIAGSPVQSLGKFPFIKEKSRFYFPVLLFHNFLPPLFFLLTATAPPPPFFNPLFHSSNTSQDGEEESSAATAGIASCSAVVKATNDAMKRVAPEVSAATPKDAPGDWPASTLTKRDEKKACSLGLISPEEGNVILPGLASHPNPPVGFTVMYIILVSRIIFVCP
jgi:hypothetical protein